MIKLYLENAINENVINKYNDQIQKIHAGLTKYRIEGNQFMGWRDLPVNYNKNEFSKIKQKSKSLKKAGVELLVVIGSADYSLGIKAGFEFVQGKHPLKKDMEIIFVGDSLSSTDIAQKMLYVKNKQFAINVISKSGKTLETNIAFRLFKNILEERLGIANAADFIITTTDANNSTLIKQSIKYGWTRFLIPDNLVKRFSIFTAVGLFPMSCAGLSIDKIMQGAKIARTKYTKNDKSHNMNIAYKYAIARYILSKKYSIELLVSYETQLSSFNLWRKQLFTESESKNRKVLLPISAIFSTDLYSFGQFIQDGPKILFETLMTVKRPNLDVQVISDSKNLDSFNYLDQTTIHTINNLISKGVFEAHNKFGKVPNIHIELDKMDELHFGQLIYFFQTSCAVSSYLLKVNPFDDSYFKIYKKTY